MKKLIVVIPFIAILILFSGCAGGFLYTDSPALEFSDLNYGFLTRTSTSSPSISYIDIGEGKETIVMVHGLASNAGFWRYNIAEFAKKYRVIAIDLPGYGKSRKDNYPYNLTFYADAVKSLLDELKIEKVIYMGHSMGGQIGIHFAIKYPAKTAKLVLVDPAGVEEFSRGQGDWLKSVVTIKGVKLTNEEGIRRNLAMNFYTWSDRLEWMVEERARLMKSKDFDDFAYCVTRSVAAMIDEPTSKKLDKIKVPVLIIYGKYDGLIPNPYLNPATTASVFMPIKNVIANCTVIEIDNAGHCLQIEQPETFNSAVLDYLK